MSAASNFEHDSTVGNPAGRVPYVRHDKMIAPDETRMSDGEVIKTVDVLDYYGTTPEADVGPTGRDALDGIVISTAAGLAIGAIGIAIHHLRKNK